MNIKKLNNIKQNDNSDFDFIPEDCHYLDTSVPDKRIITKDTSFGRKIKLVLYSHDTMGLGHIRRNLLIAQALQSSPLSFDILMITGAKEAGQFVLPKDADRLIIPSLYKSSDGEYSSRHLSLDLENIIELRSQIIKSAVQSFNPDVVIIDNVVRGACGELDRTLEFLNQNRETKLVLGMRDIKDDPLVVEEEWRSEDFENTIEQYYDEIWVYGDQNVYDPITAYSMKPNIANKVKFTGYLDHCMRIEFAKDQGLASRQLIDDLRHTPYILCMVGGGQDGLQLAEAFLHAQLDESLHGVLLTGPHMSRKDRCALFKLATQSKQMQVIDFISEPTLLLKDATAVVSMGGYNSVSEILSFNKRALIVPRVKPREEQLIRAKELSKRDIIDLMMPNKLNPNTLSKWIVHAAKIKKIDRDTSINMDGLNRIQALLRSLLDEQKFNLKSSSVTR